MTPGSEPAPVSVAARDRILQAAQALFYRHGIRATGVDRIIAEARVTKVTFYRHFPAKDDLIQAYLQQRHVEWTAWFKQALAASRASQTEDMRTRAPLAPVLETARAWFDDVGFRGCAFANTMAEAGDNMTALAGISTEHKLEVRDAIAGLLPAGDAAPDIAWAATLALDGAAVNAQLGRASAEAALEGLRTLLDALVGQPAGQSGREP